MKFICSRSSSYSNIIAQSTFVGLVFGKTTAEKRGRWAETRPLFGREETMLCVDELPTSSAQRQMTVVSVLQLSFAQW